METEEVSLIFKEVAYKGGGATCATIQQALATLHDSNRPFMAANRLSALPDAYACFYPF